MRCETFREALSARIDGEPEPVDPATVDRHLESCADCRAWYSGAQDLRRWMTVRAAPAMPDLTGVILERIPAPTGERWPVRIGLGIVALAQLALSVAQLLGAATGMDAMSGASMLEHLTHESTAWNIAVGIGLLWAALRPRAAAGQLPVMTGFVLVLTGLSIADLLGHAVSLGRLASHVFVVIGLALLFVVRHQHRDDRLPGAGDALTPGRRVEPSGSTSDAPDAPQPHHPRWHRPASRHHAA
ncbi:zf-HC2 domain-containing protein [Amycolatopsis sp. GM8]|uniref:zf-HC2 domain-containing protein n=1 Tax=Amycolatopsis sp. GM8 TaxID=2896530 RepID=UPI001F43CDCD|nr:zf-HC2 domain-containing protein [Amycolatopsis sp. GM8]